MQYALRFILRQAIRFIACPRMLNVNQLRLLGRHAITWGWDYLSLGLHNAERVTCGCCGWKGNRFFLYTSLSSEESRKNAVCPRCGALERQRDLMAYLRASPLLRSGPITLLDVAPTKAVVDWLSQYLDIRLVTVDLSSPLADIRMDVTRMAFRDDVFDLILCSHVLEHVKEDIMALRELYRVTKQGGAAILQVPIDHKLPQTREYAAPDPNDYWHARLYGRDFIQRLRSVGWYGSEPGESGVFYMVKNSPSQS